MHSTAPGLATGGPTRNVSAFGRRRKRPSESASRTAAMPPPLRKSASMSVVTPDKSYVVPSAMTAGISAPGSPSRAIRIRECPSSVGIGPDQFDVGVQQYPESGFIGDLHAPIHRQPFVEQHGREHRYHLLSGGVHHQESANGLLVRVTTK